MKLKDVDLLKLLPKFMKQDKYDSLLATGMSNLFQKMSIEMDRVVIVGQIDKLNEDELDQLARDQGIFWYQYSANLTKKREIIKNAPLIFNRLGTVWAVEKVMNEYFDNTELQEWFDYEGDPHHFRFKTEDTNILKADIYGFLSILEKIKRKSQWLDEIILALRAETNIYGGFGMVEKSKHTFYFGVTPNELDTLV